MQNQIDCLENLGMQEGAKGEWPEDGRRDGWGMGVQQTIFGVAKTFLGGSKAFF